MNDLHGPEYSLKQIPCAACCPSNCDLAEVVSTLCPEAQAPVNASGSLHTTVNLPAGLSRWQSTIGLE